jgi:hypothetical protein
MLRLLFFWDMTWHHISEEQKPHIHCSRNLETEIVKVAGQLRRRNNQLHVAKRTAYAYSEQLHSVTCTYVILIQSHTSETLQMVISAVYSLAVLHSLQYMDV